MNKVVKAFNDAITEKVINAMKKGTAPWQKPWKVVNVPHNAFTGKAYRGINTIILMLRGEEIDGGADPRWLTFNQANNKGWSIKKGSKGTAIVLWKPVLKPIEEKETPKDPEQVKTQDGKFEIVTVVQRLFTVFHASQIQGIPEYEPEKELSEVTVQKKAEKIIQASGAIIQFGGNEAFYDKFRDYVKVPPRGRFKSTNGYYSTIMHELSHWTGHSSRLNRDLSYAREEVVAEMSSMFLSGITKIPQSEREFENHVSYIDSWLKEIEDDPKALIKAARDASKAADLLAKALSDKPEESEDEVNE